MFVHAEWGGGGAELPLEVQARNIRINVGVAAPVAFYRFCGMKESFFGDLYGQGRDAEFYMEKKVVVERW